MIVLGGLSCVALCCVMMWYDVITCVVLEFCVAWYSCFVLCIGVLVLWCVMLCVIMLVWYGVYAIIIYPTLRHRDIA